MIGIFGYKTGTLSVVDPGHGAEPQPGTASETVVGPYVMFHWTLMQFVPAPEMITPLVTVQLYVPHTTGVQNEDIPPGQTVP